VTDHETVGEIAGHEVTVSVSGPEAQDLDDDRIGADVLMSRINEKLTELKQSEDTSMEGSR
jgi:hypothetical protein